MRPGCRRPRIYGRWPKRVTPALVRVPLLRAKRDAPPLQHWWCVDNTGLCNDIGVLHRESGAQRTLLLRSRLFNASYVKQPGMASTPTVDSTRCARWSTMAGLVELPGRVKYKRAAARRVPRRSSARPRARHAGDSSAAFSSWLPRIPAGRMRASWEAVPTRRGDYIACSHRQ